MSAQSRNCQIVTYLSKALYTCWLHFISGKNENNAVFSETRPPVSINSQPPTCKTNSFAGQPDNPGFFPEVPSKQGQMGCRLSKLLRAASREGMLEGRAGGVLNNGNMTVPVVRGRLPA